MKNVFNINLTLTFFLFFLLTSVVSATEYKCFVLDNIKGQHIVLVDTTDMGDAKRAALASTVSNQFGRSSEVEKVLECKLEHAEFSSKRARLLDDRTPR